MQLKSIIDTGIQFVQSRIIHMVILGNDVLYNFTIKSNKTLTFVIKQIIYHICLYCMRKRKDLGTIGPLWCSFYIYSLWFGFPSLTSQLVPVHVWRWFRGHLSDLAIGLVQARQLGISTSKLHTFPHQTIL